MKIISLVLAFSLIFAVVLSACGPKRAPAIGEATVNAEHASLRARNSATSRTIQVMEPGDNVQILERQDRWYKVRAGDIEGWMDESTLVTEEMRKQTQEVLDSARNQVPQNTGTLVQDANLRLVPGRSTSILRRVNSQTPVEVLERKTLPRDDLPGRNDVWLKVRTGPKEVGWILSSFVEFDVPEEISRYTEDLAYSAVKTVHQIEDPIAGTIRWYIVGERKPPVDPNLDFNGIRVFTWNTGKQRYETAFRKRDVRGVYPLEVGQQEGKPTFRVHELGPDGVTKTAKDYVMFGVVVREVKK
jgi:uncharacterized protein YgiM (DUF1202 family)